MSRRRPSQNRGLFRRPRRPQLRRDSEREGKSVRQVHTRAHSRGQRTLRRSPLPAEQGRQPQLQGWGRVEAPPPGRENGMGGLCWRTPGVGRGSARLIARGEEPQRHDQVEARRAYVEKCRWVWPTRACLYHCILYRMKETQCASIYTSTRALLRKCVHCTIFILFYFLRNSTDVHALHMKLEPHALCNSILHTIYTLRTLACKRSVQINKLKKPHRMQ